MTITGVGHRKFLRMYNNGKIPPGSIVDVREDGTRFTYNVLDDGSLLIWHGDPSQEPAQTPQDVLSRRKWKAYQNE